MLFKLALSATNRLARTILSLALVFAFVASVLVPAYADNTTGTITGVVSDATGPVRGVSVAAVSASASYRAVTDAKGFFSIIGVSPDTYSVSFTLSGYQQQTVSGINVPASLTTTVSQTLLKSASVIGRTTSRTTTSAFNPQQAIDTISVNSKQVDTLLGKAKATNEANLLVRLPGATLDSSGYPVLRGGRENEEGFQFEGIDYTDAFTSQFVNTLELNGLQNFQLTPGGGDASVGNAGTGQINITLKRGSRPAFGVFDAEATSPVYGHQLSGDYGFATPNGKFSNYASFVGQRNGSDYGPRGSDLTLYGRPISQNYYSANDFVDNLIFKFGRDNNQSLQAVYQGQSNNFSLAFNGPTLNFKSGDPVEAYYFGLYTGFSPATIGSLLSFGIGQTSQTQALNRPPENYDQPNQTLKLQYSNNLDATTFLTAKLYKVNAVTVFDFPYSGIGFGGFDDAYLNQGGQRTGAQLDLTKQIGDKNLLALGAKYEFLHPVDAYQSATGGFYSTLFDYGGEVFDFASAAQGGTGYLAPYFPNGVPRVPVYNQQAITDRQDLSFYLKDDFQATKALKITAGIRVDSTNYRLPGVGAGAFLPADGLGYSSANYLPTSTGTYAGALGSGTTIVNGVDVSGLPNPALDRFNTGGNGVKNPFIPEPRLAFAYQFRSTDAITASYGRSVQLAPITYLDAHVPMSTYAAFAGVPSTVNYNGGAVGPPAGSAGTCGPTGDRECANYADQLYWSNQLIGDGIPSQPVRPSTFNNFDASYSHDFGHGVAVKLTPFYRRGYDAFALVSTARLGPNGQPILDANGAPLLNPAVATNLGVNKTTGVEFYLTKDAEYGLSGSLSATYLNEFSNVVPLSGSEDFFPSIPPASLALGNLYRVGFISPFNVAAALSYRTRSGWRINPIVTYNRGYPYGNGTFAATTINNVAVNVKQTNVTNQAATGGTTGATNYVDPQNPGSQFNPNIAATRGTPEGANPGSYLNAPRAAANISLEYNKPNTRSTFGVLVTNLFNQLYGLPGLNSRYQPVANGISGPITGTSSTTARFGENYGFVNTANFRDGNQPYVLSPNQTGITYRFYYQISL